MFYKFSLRIHVRQKCPNTDHSVCCKTGNRYSFVYGFYQLCYVCMELFPFEMQSIQTVSLLSVLWYFPYAGR